MTNEDDNLPPIRCLEIPCDSSGRPMQCRVDSMSTVRSLSNYNLSKEVGQDSAPIQPGRMASIPRLTCTSSERFKAQGKDSDAPKAPGRRQSAVRMPDRRAKFPSRQDTASDLSSSYDSGEENKPSLMRCSGGINIYRDC